MFVPIATDFLPQRGADSLWFFYYFLSVFKRERYPLIAPSYYFNDVATWTKQGRKEAEKGEWPNYYLYDPPRQKDLDAIEQVPIPDILYEECAAQTGSYTDATILIYSKIWDPLYSWSYNQFERLQKREKIEAVIMLNHIPSIYKAASDLGIRVIHTEWSPLRPPTYRRMVYLDFTDLANDATDCQPRWKKSKKLFKQLPVLNRKALLSLLLSEESLPLLSCLNWDPSYELGIVNHESSNPILLRYGHLGSADLLAGALKVYKKNEILFRDRPWGGSFAVPEGIQKKSFVSPAEFITHCRRVVCVSSNMGFETMLWGRTAYILNPNPVRFMAKTDLADTSAALVDEEFLNFFLFGYLIPYERLMDVEYLRWRLNMPSEEEIYLNNLNYYLAQHSIDIQEIMSSNEIADKILSKRGVDKDGFGMESKSLAAPESSFTAHTEIKKLLINRNQPNQNDWRLVGINNGSFSFCLSVKKTKQKMNILFETPAGAIVKLKATLPSGDEVDVIPLNALPDGVTFVYGNPTFEIATNAQASLLLVYGEYKEESASDLAQQWYSDALLLEKGENWELSHRLQDASAEVEKLLQDRKELLARINMLEEIQQQGEKQINMLEEIRQQRDEQINMLEELRQQRDEQIMELKGRYDCLQNQLKQHRIKSMVKIFLGREI